MLFYILFALSVIYLLLLNYFVQQKTSFFLIVALIIVIFIAGLREDVGSDFATYKHYYQDINSGYQMEFGFEFVVNIIRLLNINYHFLFFIFSAATCLFAYFGIRKYTQNSSLAFLIFFLIPGLYLNSFIILRQAFAVSISFYAFYYLINKKYFTYVILVFIGFSIHYTALIAVVIHLFAYKFSNVFSKRKLFTVLLISLAFTQINLFNLLATVFENMKYAVFFENNDAEKVSLMKIIVLNSVACLVLFKYDSLILKFPNQQYFIVIYLFSVILTNVFSAFSLVTRISYYFRIFEIIVIADLIYLGTKKYRIVFLLGFILYYFGIYLISLDANAKAANDDTKLIPYKNAFFM